ncbi:hypothetical protein QJS10_CPA01g00910 [Acorus calamus]|uniref:AT hook motif-containing protein n=1 Tax=Acorus calamus TaxID=4465 RepID=A0AAV9FGU7_ACOCL|nr:hypothetical protein QJS10_CPA01g00910 [Acorus calamus]
MMSQQDHVMSSATSETTTPPNRKRGRPPKSASSELGRLSQHNTIPTDNTDDDAFIGQMVSGVVDGMFDAGYMLTVRVADSETMLRGVIFEPGLSIPITTENDVAPDAKMFKRVEVPISSTQAPKQGVTDTNANIIPPIRSQPLEPDHSPVVAQAVEGKITKEVGVTQEKENETSAPMNGPMNAENSVKTAMESVDDKPVPGSGDHTPQVPAETLKEEKNAHAPDDSVEVTKGANADLAS